MADIALVTAARVDVIESLEQATIPAGEAITPGAPVRFDTSTGKFVNGNATDAAEGRIYGIAVGQMAIAAGTPCTAIRNGVIGGFTLSGDYGASVFISDTDARLADTYGTVYLPIGFIIPITHAVIGSSYDKAIKLDPNAFGNLSNNAARVVVQTELLAASVDKWLFVADRAYQVVAVREIHSVVGGSGAVTRPRKVTAAGTDAPGDAAGATVKELTAANIDLTTTINVSQSPALTATAADLLLAAGDKIGTNMGGTLTGLVGVMNVFLRPV